MRNKYDYSIRMNISGLTYDTNIAESATGIFSAKPVKEIKGGVPQYTIPMIGTTVNKTSRNGVTMTKFELDNMINKELVTDRIANKSFMCEMNHPTNEEDVKRFRSVDMDNLSHQILEFFYTPGDTHLAFMMRTARTRQGMILANILEDGGNVAVSLRAFATVGQKNGQQFKDIYCVSYDSVFMPSNRESWSVQMMEAADFSNDKLARFGITVGEINKFKNNSYSNLINKEKRLVERMNLVENYIANSGYGGKILDFNDLNGVNETVSRIAESAKLDDFKPTHILISESNNEIVLCNKEMTATALAESALIKDMMKRIDSKFRG